MFCVVNPPDSLLFYVVKSPKSVLFCVVKSLDSVLFCVVKSLDSLLFCVVNPPDSLLFCVSIRYSNEVFMNNVFQPYLSFSCSDDVFPRVVCGILDVRTQHPAKHFRQCLPWSSTNRRLYTHHITLIDGLCYSGQSILSRD